jgi:hypothetical protein
MADLYYFMDHPNATAHIYKDKFFNEVARPMYMAWMDRKNKTGDGREWADIIAAGDWRLACLEWLNRANERRIKKDEQSK